MMPDWRIGAVLAGFGAVSYAMRVGGYLLAGAMPQDGIAARLLRLAPGNLFIAFVAAACLEGGWPSLAGSFTALAALRGTGKEWVALAAAFATAALASACLTR